MIQFGADEYVLSPRIDQVFKMLFTQNIPESRLALMDFLESVIGRGVKEVTIQGNEPASNRIGEKQPSMDFNCLFNDGDQANVEIQAWDTGNMAPRSEYYLCKLHCSQANKGMEYDELRYTYQITVLDYPVLSPDLPFLNEYGLRDSSGRELEGSRIRLYYLELTKLQKLLAKPTDELTRPEKWALFFKYVDDAEKRDKINEIIRKEEGLEMASRMLEQMAKDSELMKELISRERAERDRINALRYAEKKAMEKGMEKGRRDLIRSMAKAGASFELIAKATELSMDEIKKIVQ